MENLGNNIEQEKWLQYYERTKDSKPRPLLKEVINLIDNKNEALDLGSGALNDTIYLISSGFNHVTAVDGTQVPTDLPQETKDYYKECFDRGEKPLVFHRVQHILYKVSINVEGLNIVKI